MKTALTRLDGVLLIHPPTVFKDFRGEYVELYNQKLYREAGIDVTFIQDDVSVSHRNVLRGIHGDHKTWKLISCLYGEFYFVVVNCNERSSDFGKWESFVLSEQNRLQVLVPPSYGNAHVVLSDKAVFHYKQSTYYDRDSQFSYVWNDPRFGISWPVRDPILSKRDQAEG